MPEKRAKDWGQFDRVLDAMIAYKPATRPKSRKPRQRKKKQGFGKTCI